MNLLLIPCLVTFALTGFFAVLAGVGLVLLLHQSSSQVGKALLRYSGVPLLAGVVIAWAGLLLLAVLKDFLGEAASILLLWASGPVGAFVGLLDVRRKDRRRAQP